MANPIGFSTNGVNNPPTPGERTRRKKGAKSEKTAETAQPILSQAATPAPAASLPEIKGQPTSKELELSSRISQLEEVIKTLQSKNDVQQSAFQKAMKINKELSQSVRGSNLESLKSTSYIEEKDINTKKPKTIDLESILHVVDQDIKSFETLGEKINTLRDNAQKCYERTGAGIVKEEFSKELAGYDAEYASLFAECQKVLPRIYSIKDTLGELVKSATLAGFTESQLEAFEQKTGYLKDDIQAAERRFTETHAKCSSAHRKLVKDIEHIKRRFENACKHLNDIDNYLETLPGGLVNRVKYAVGMGASNTRVSPFDSKAETQKQALPSLEKVDSDVQEKEAEFSEALDTPSK